MNPLEMMMQMVMGGEQQAPQPTPGMPREFLEGKRLRPGRVTGVPQESAQMMGGEPEGAGLDPEMIRLMMGGAG